jgi:hypothetical protein
MERVKTAFNFRIFIEIGGKLFMWNQCIEL